MQDDRFARLAYLLPFPIGVLSSQISRSFEPSLVAHDAKQFNVISNRRDPRLVALTPFRLPEATSTYSRVPPTAGIFQIPRACWTGAGSLEPCLTQEPNRT